jgi:hypothetical protein
MSSISSRRIRADASRAAATLAERFDLSEAARMRLEDCLPSFVPERFAIPYADGGELALQRVFGSEMRAAFNAPRIHPETMIAYDRLTFEGAGILEYIDRHGARSRMVMGTQSPDGLILVGAPRVEPISAADILPPMREALACLYKEMTGRKPSKKDYRKRAGPIRKVAVPGSPADFIQAALTSIGWIYTDADIARTYRNLLIIPWRNRGYL